MTKPSANSSVTAEPKPGWAERLKYFESRQAEMIETIREFVEIESPSDNKGAADRMGMFLAEKFKALGGAVKFHRAEKFGDHLQINFSCRSGSKPVLLLGHFDTVYPMGTIDTMLCGQAGDRLHGPGVLDMKSGIAMMFYAIEALKKWNEQLPRPVTVFLVSDEEVGSDSSRKITEALAKESDAVLVLEPAAGSNGALKTARKGVGEYLLKIKGVAAHAGLDPGKGHSAVLELAHQIGVLAKMTDLKRGLSVNVGVVQGGRAAMLFPRRLRRTSMSALPVRSRPAPLTKSCGL